MLAPHAAIGLNTLHHPRVAPDRFAAARPAGALEAFAEERSRTIGETDYLVDRLPIEFEIELSPWLPVIPIGQMLELAATHWTLRESVKTRNPRAIGSQSMLCAEYEW